MFVFRTDSARAFLLVCSITVLSPVAIAAPPASAARQSLNLPDIPLLDAAPLPDNPQQRAAMSRILQGEQEPAGAAELPQDLKELVQQSGSILQGSSLDPALDLHGHRATDSDAGRPRQSDDDRWRTAEMLLKTARLLDKLQPVSKNQADLVNQMRQEAVLLLQSTVPVATNQSRQWPDNALPQPTSQADPLGIDSKLIQERSSNRRSLPSPR